MTDVITAEQTRGKAHLAKFLSGDLFFLSALTSANTHSFYLQPTCYFMHIYQKHVGVQRLKSARVNTLKKRNCLSEENRIIKFHSVLCFASKDLFFILHKEDRNLLFVNYKHVSS